MRLLSGFVWIAKNEKVLVFDFSGLAEEFAGTTESFWRGCRLVRRCRACHYAGFFAMKGTYAESIHNRRCQVELRLP
jgi:hypothetical protein